MALPNSRYRNEDVKQAWYNFIWTSITRQFVGVGLNLMSKYVFVSGNKKEFCVSFDINLKKRKTTHIFCTLGKSLTITIEKRITLLSSFEHNLFQRHITLLFLSHAKQQLFDVPNNWEAHTSCKYFHKVSYICQVQFKN